MELATLGNKTLIYQIEIGDRKTVILLSKTRHIVDSEHNRPRRDHVTINSCCVNILLADGVYHVGV